MSWRGTQVVRERSAKPLRVSSILTRASILLHDVANVARSHFLDVAETGATPCRSASSTELEAGVLGPRIYAVISFTAGASWFWRAHLPMQNLLPCLM